ncbi:hypothetical protein JYP52_20565 [Nitratireductor aquibiodomus]|uniref:hypothetical protein n=1 Tax=Nitratireductor aquibiodomus TaxID=204799 RepID=UPI0019D32EF4|nr:hypothetical protein [Nitratireductor aquibiodomus]MBN7763536.1 hypothetical protein [Nitratireductor aquibiodomus]
MKMEPISVLEGRVNKLMLDAEHEASHLRSLCSGEYQNRDFETHIIEGSGHVVQLDFKSGEVKTYSLFEEDHRQTPRKIFHDDAILQIRVPIRATFSELAEALESEEMELIVREFFEKEHSTESAQRCPKMKLLTSIFNGKVRRTLRDPSKEHVDLSDEIAGEEIQRMLTHLIYGDDEDEHESKPSI